MTRLRRAALVLSLCAVAAGRAAAQSDGPPAVPGAPNPWQPAPSTAAPAGFPPPASPFGAPAASTPAPFTAPSVSPTGAYLGDPLSISGGPWVPGEVLFFEAGRVVADYSWRDRVRARRGQLYTSADLQSDVQELLSLNKFDRVTPSVFAIPNSPVPTEYSSISASTAQVRVVFDVVEKSSTTAVKPRIVTPPTAVGGVLLTPTAWRGAGRHTGPGLALDINAAYFIGRLYGKNSLQDTPRKTDYIDRIGLWMLATDGKMQVQSETSVRPAMAVGGQAMLIFRDAPQPTVAAPGVTVTVDTKRTQVLTDGYIVFSKKLGPMRTSAGVMQGTVGELAGQLSEYLTPEALKFYAHEPTGTEVHSRTVPFLSTFYLIKPDYPIGVELMKFNGAARSPWLLDFKIGRFLKLNFDVAYLKYRGGYDFIGMFQFRYNHFPKN